MIDEHNLTPLEYEIADNLLNVIEEYVNAGGLMSASLVVALCHVNKVLLNNIEEQTTTKWATRCQIQLALNILTALLPPDTPVGLIQLRSQQLTAALQLN